MSTDPVPDVAQLCLIQWGICPDHGPTLTASGGVSWCHFPECGRRWDYDRLDQPCAELATHSVTDRKGTRLTTCSAHAAEARQMLDGAVVEPLTPPPPGA